MPWARASELDRLMACPAAGHLPRLVQISDRAQDAAAWGTLMHAWAETGEAPKGVSKRTLQAWQDRMDVIAAAGKTREDYWPLDGEHEVVVCLGLVNGELFLGEMCGGTLEERDTWKAAQPATVVVGTMDYRGWLLDSWWVDDLKTGREGFPPLSKRAMQFYSSYQALKTSKPGYASITHWPRSPAGNLPQRTKGLWGTWTPTEARVFVKEMEAARLAIQRSGERDEADARAGEHCTYCPSQMRCPEIIGGEAYEVSE